VVTVALDIRPEDAHPWIDAAAPTHVALIDPHHQLDEALGIVNVPMAVWIDEHGRIVRPAEQASIERSPLRDMEIPDGLPDRMRVMLEQVKAIPAGEPDAYRAALEDFARHGAESRFALSPDEVLGRADERPADHARAAACFELGQHLFHSVGHDAAVPWWREAHRLFPGNWSYKRQAWTLVTTPEGAKANDLVQGPTEVYEGNWLDDVLASGGGEAYYPRLNL
jgi:hypothetical protein